MEFVATIDWMLEKFQYRNRRRTIYLCHRNLEILLWNYKKIILRYQKQKTGILIFLKSLSPRYMEKRKTVFTIQLGVQIKKRFPLILCMRHTASYVCGILPVNRNRNIFQSMVQRDVSGRSSKSSLQFYNYRRCPCCVGFC